MTGRSVDEVERRLVRLWELVLAVGAIGVTDDFFQLGADSLIAATLAADISREFGVDCSARTVMTARTIRQVAAIVRAGAAVSGPVVPPAPTADRYPLSPQQRQLYVEQFRNAEATHYNLPLSLDLGEQVDASRLADAFRRVIARHEALRTDFTLLDGTPMQRVHPEVEFRLERGRWPGPAVADFVRPFDLGHAPLLRAGLFTDSEGHARLLVDIHHSIADGTSLGILLSEVQAAYRGSALPPIPLQYKDYAHWLSFGEGRRWQAGQLSHWLAQFSTAPAVLDLPTDFPRPAVPQLAGAVVEFTVDEVATAGLRRLAADQGATLFHVLLATYTVMLSGPTGQPDITVGTPAAGRSLPGFDKTIGMFVNTLCLRNEVREDQPFAELLRTVRDRTLVAFAHQDVPFPELVSQVLAGRRTANRNPLFDTLLALHRGSLIDGDFLGASVELAVSMPDHAMFDLNMQVFEVGSALRVFWGYRTALFTEATVRGLFESFLAVARAALADPTARIRDLRTDRHGTGAVANLDIDFDF